MSADQENKNPRKPQLGDPDYDLRSFGNELTGGGLRWVATILVLATLGFIIYLATNYGWAASVQGPLPIQGGGLYTVLCIVLLIWVGLGIVNWRNWSRSHHQNDET